MYSKIKEGGGCTYVRTYVPGMSWPPVLALIPVEARDIFQDYVANIQETIETVEIFLDNLRTAHMTQILYQMYH